MKIIKKRRKESERSPREAMEEIQSNRINDIHELESHPSTSSSSKKSVLILILIAIIALSAVAIVIITYKKPDLFTSKSPTGTTGTTETTEKTDSLLEKQALPSPDVTSGNPKIKSGKESFSKGYFTDALTSFNEVVESDASDSDKAIALLYIGMISHERKDYNKAIEYYKRALGYDKNNPAIFKNLALTYRLKGNYKGAMEAAQKALAFGSNNVDTLILVANIYFELGQYKDAIKIYQKILEQNNNQPTVLYNLASAFLKTGDEFAAIEYFKKAANAGGVSEAGFRALSRLGILFTEQRKYDLAENYLVKAKAIRPSDPVVRYNLGIVYMKMDKRSKALEEFAKSEELSSKDSEMLENIGEAYYSIKDYNKSLSTFERLQSITPRNIRILSRMGDIYYQMGALDKALDAYRRITRLEPATENARIAYLNIGNILDDAQRYDEAITSFKKALTLNPKDHSTLYNLGIAYKHAGKPELAIQAWKNASRLKTDDPAPSMAIADYYYEKGFFDLSEKEYQMMYSRWPQNQEVHFKLATIYFKTNRKQDALRAYERIIKLNDRSEFARKSMINSAIILSEIDNSPENMKRALDTVQKALIMKPGSADGLFALGMVYAKQLMYDQAIETFYQVLRATQNSRQISEAYNNIGKSYYSKGNFKKALQAFTRGIEEDPTNEEIRINRKVAMQAYERTIKGQ